MAYNLLTSEWIINFLYNSLLSDSLLVLHSTNPCWMPASGMFLNLSKLESINLINEDVFTIFS